MPVVGGNDRGARRVDDRRQLLLKNFYTAELTKQDRRWVIDAPVIENVWLSGDPEVRFPQPTA